MLSIHYMMSSDQTIESRKKEMVRNLYSSGIPVDIIALQSDLTTTSVLAIIKEIESGAGEIICPYCISVYKTQKEILEHVSKIHSISF